MFQTLLIKIYYAILHSIMSYGMYFGGILLTVPKFLRFKQELSELSREKGVETFVGICLNN